MVAQLKMTIKCPQEATYCDSQNLLRLWPALLIGNALTVQQSMCAQQEAPPEALPEQADRPGRLSSSWAVAKEEVATTLR